MIKCENCKKDLPFDAAFCSDCRTVVKDDELRVAQVAKIESAVRVQCPHCKQVFPIPIQVAQVMNSRGTMPGYQNRMMGGMENRALFSRRPPTGPQTRVLTCPNPKCGQKFKARIPGE